MHARLLLVPLLGLSLAGAIRAAPGAYAVDASASTLTITVGKAGFFSRFGHTHTVVARKMRGEVRADPARPASSSVHLVFPATGLEVTDEELSDKDRASVQEHMQEPPCLSVTAFPEIAFTSSAVEVGAAKGPAYDLRMRGTLSLRGIEHEIELPVKVQLKGDVLEADGDTTLKQTDFGITPNKVALGTIAVKDELKIHFHVVARRPAARD